MNKIAIITMALLAITLNTKAADLPAEIGCLNISSTDNDIQYITEDGQIAYLECDDDNIYEFGNFADSPKVFFSDVRSFAESYALSETYYINNNGDLYKYSIDGDTEEHSKVEGISDCVKVCCGQDYVLVLKSDGTVWAWGENKYGQLGDGTSEPKETPSKIDSLEEIVDITAGNNCAYAVDSEGKVYGWGQHRLLNEYGIYEGLYYNNIPHEVMKGVENCIRVDAANEYTFVMTYSGDIYKCYNTDTEAVKMDNVGKCVDMSSQPWGTYVFTPMLLAEDGNVWQWSYSTWVVDGWQSEHPNKTTYIDDLVKVVAGVKNAYIKSDGSVWVTYPSEEDGYWNHGKAVCIVDSENDYKLKMDSVRFVKRSEAADMFSKLYEEITGKVADANSIEYNDVDADSKYKNGIQKCTSLGIMNGTDEENNFSPNKVLRREQAAVILDRLCNLSGVELKDKTEKYDDDEKISDWAKESVYKTAELFERQNNVYNPHEYITYDELECVIEKVKSL